MGYNKVKRHPEYARGIFCFQYRLFVKIPPHANTLGRNDKGEIYFPAVMTPFNTSIARSS